MFSLISNYLLTSKFSFFCFKNLDFSQFSIIWLKTFLEWWFALTALVQHLTSFRDQLHKDLAFIVAKDIWLDLLIFIQNNLLITVKSSLPRNTVQMCVELVQNTAFLKGSSQLERSPGFLSRSRSTSMPSCLVSRPRLESGDAPRKCRQLLTESEEGVWSESETELRFIEQQGVWSIWLHEIITGF